jgi:hypothetical protein
MSKKILVPQSARFKAAFVPECNLVVGTHSCTMNIYQGNTIMVDKDNPWREGSLYWKSIGSLRIAPRSDFGDYSKEFYGRSLEGVIVEAMINTSAI